ncbi:MAG: RNA methyltransferase [Bacteroidales bacterium]|nr:RNA methyltransferase [Bacteroidales bacterium]
MTGTEIKYIKSLSQKKFRDERGVFVVEGEKMVKEALNSGFVVEKVFRTEDIGEAAMRRISSLSSPSPALAVVRKPLDIDKADVPSKGLFLALDGIRDPGNLGTILRIADWFGIDAVYASEDTVDVFNPKVVQATMGAIFRVKFHYCSVPALCKDVLARGGRVYGTFLDGENMYQRPLECGYSVIVIGNEANGISRETAACVSDRLFIPPYPANDPGSESLNAAVATAVTVAEFRRPR